MKRLDARAGRPLAAALLLLAACDPVFHVEGTVVDPTGAPVDGATVTYSCPSGRTESATTSAAGTFSFGGVGGTFEAPSCSLRIEKPGFVALTIPTKAACFRSTEVAAKPGTPCAAGEGRLVLAR